MTSSTMTCSWMTCSPCRLTAGSRRAFSLVEVLIAVFVLSLGMLGLASIFPVILREQRAAGETTEGTIALGSVESALRSNLALNRRGPNVGWGIFQDDADQDDGWSRFGQWMTPVLLGPGEPQIPSRMFVDQATGLLRIVSDDPVGPSSTNPFGDDVLIPQSARLGPAPFVRGSTPRVEWIMAARRIITHVDLQNRLLPTDTDELEVVVFVRAIDRGIQVPRRDRKLKSEWARLGRAMNLSDVLLRNEPALYQGNQPEASASEARVPVAVRQNTGAPTGNGQGLYAVPFTFALKDYQFDEAVPNNVRDDDRDRLQIDLPTNSPLLPLISQPGQKLVDGRGNIYTVRGAVAGNASIVLIDPPVPSSIVSSLDISPLVANPTIPIAVELFRVRP